MVTRGSAAVEDEVVVDQLPHKVVFGSGSECSSALALAVVSFRLIGGGWWLYIVYVCNGNGMFEQIS